MKAQKYNSWRFSCCHAGVGPPTTTTTISQILIIIGDYRTGTVKWTLTHPLNYLSDWLETLLTQSAAGEVQYSFGYCLRLFRSSLSGNNSEMCNWKLVCSCIGLAICIVGAVLGWAVFPNIIRNEIKNVRDRRDLASGKFVIF